MPIIDKIQKDFSLKELSTFKVGGKAEFFLEISNKEDLEDAFHWGKKNKKRVWILGGGSNLLINDKNIDGLVLKISNNEITVKGDRVECGAGSNLNKILFLSRANNLSGMEWAIGIPQATIGGAIRGNAGAFGDNISNIVEMVEVFNIKTGRFKMFSNKDCEFNYRYSIFKKDKKYIIWMVILKMVKSNFIDISKKIEKNLNFRRNKQPKLPSAGSVFKNLKIEDIKEMSLKTACFIEEQGVIKSGKVSAGFLIDQAGLKGKAIGGAKISLEHANFIVNTGNATAQDVCQLINMIKKRVEQRFGIKLEEEIQYFGF